MSPNLEVGKALIEFRRIVVLAPVGEILNELVPQRVRGRGHAGENRTDSKQAEEQRHLHGSRFVVLFVFFFCLESCLLFLQSA